MGCVFLRLLGDPSLQLNTEKKMSKTVNSGHVEDINSPHDVSACSVKDDKVTDAGKHNRLTVSVSAIRPVL